MAVFLFFLLVFDSPLIGGGAMPFAISIDLGYDLITTIRFSALYPFLSAFLCFFFLRESKKLTEMKK